jgi:hypothetical protein
MKKIIVLLLILASPLFAEKGTSNFKKVFTQEEKQIFLDSMNKYRLAKGLKRVEYYPDIENLAKIRIKTISKHRKEVLSSITKEEYRKNHLYHLHFGLYEDMELFNINLKSNRKKNYIMAIPSENIALFFENDGQLIYSLFDGWKHSPSHWDAMMKETIDTVALEMGETDVGIIACLVLFKRLNKK